MSPRPDVPKQTRVTLSPVLPSVTFSVAMFLDAAAMPASPL